MTAHQVGCYLRQHASQRVDFLLEISANLLFLSVLPLHNDWQQSPHALRLSCIVNTLVGIEHDVSAHFLQDICPELPSQFLYIIHDTYQVM